MSKPAPVYLIAEVEVFDPPAFKAYQAKVQATLEPFGGQFLVKGGRAEAVEGAPPAQIVVIRFTDMETAKAWEASAAYQAIRPLRLASAETRFFLVEGLDGAN